MAEAQEEFVTENGLRDRPYSVAVPLPVPHLPGLPLPLDGHESTTLRITRLAYELSVRLEFNKVAEETLRRCAESMVRHHVKVAQALATCALHAAIKHRVAVDAVDIAEALEQMGVKEDGIEFGVPVKAIDDVRPPSVQERREWARLMLTRLIGVESPAAYKIANSVAAALPPSKLTTPAVRHMAMIVLRYAFFKGSPQYEPKHINYGVVMTVHLNRRCEAEDVDLKVTADGVHGLKIIYVMDGLRYEVDRRAKFLGTDLLRRYVCRRFGVALAG